jgi:hypothetical protein
MQNYEEAEIYEENHRQNNATGGILNGPNN